MLPQSASSRGSPHRSFPPGSHWFDARLYAGTGAGDSLIRDRIAPLCIQLVEQGVAERWFFLRYADPDFHLRVRLEGEPEPLWRHALPLFNELAEGLIERRMIWRMTLDTYEPEIVRYGGPAAIGLAERWFCADSEAAAQALTMQYQRRANADQRRHLALAATHVALRQLIPEPDARHAAIRTARDNLDGLGRKIPDPRELPQRSLDERYAERYRNECPALEAALRNRPPGIDAYSRRAERFEQIAAELRALDERHELTSTVPEIAISLIHMRVNRVPPSARVASNLEPELRLYDTLERLYSSGGFG